MKEQEKIRFGIIGAGNIGKVHVKTISQLPDEAETVAITDVHLPLAEERATENGIATVYRTAEELLADPNIQVAVIGVPNKYHAPLAIQALEAGKHVILEKPMAIDLEAAKAIVRAQRKAGRFVMIPHQMRWEAAAQRLKQTVESGELGRIYYAKTGLFRRKGIPGWGTWFTRKELAGGGPLIDIGVHMLDLALYLMGDPKPASVFGSTFAEFGPHRRGIGKWGTHDWGGSFDVEDLAGAMIKMEDGTALSLEVSWAVNGNVEQNGPFVHLMGTDGGASLRGKEGKLFAERSGEIVDTQLDIPEGAGNPREAMYRHFIECLRNGTEPISNVTTGFTNNLILDAIYRSSRTGNEIKLDWHIDD
ncbi:Gfo/Idh/MocA family oxidoreductase [Paenibacillus mesophilus]|uniref:Gfo/Idh/MocA family protein n=1 Tax=Paenibacillus mesophilus TaxID=2582849 RepID=UPI00110D3865|nr:Gfo/Idh/MocA family oxidoreductase [Paenibacillus mesophilus]TMV49910.1 Gfo/Idh/MocA family oxidoreductase [Paenibacillus mesophilus]